MNKREQTFLLVKITHSLIWFVMVLAIFYTLYSGITNTINLFTYLSIGLIFFETFVLFLNQWACPLTHLSQRVKSDWKDGDDIFLPKWLAIHNKVIFGSLFSAGLLLVLYRLIN